MLNLDITGAERNSPRKTGVPGSRGPRVLLKPTLVADIQAEALRGSGAISDATCDESKSAGATRRKAGTGVSSLLGIDADGVKERPFMGTSSRRPNRWRRSRDGYFAPVSSLTMLVAASLVLMERMGWRCPIESAETLGSRSLEKGRPAGSASLWLSLSVDRSSAPTAIVIGSENGGQSGRREQPVKNR